MANKVYEIVTQRVIKKIEESIQNGSVLPWQKPWNYANSAQNYVTGKRYHGINNLLLDAGEYLTWTQFCDLKKSNPTLKLKKGYKQEMVVFFNFTEYEKEKATPDGSILIEKQKIPFLRYYNVFDSSNVIGLERKLSPQAFEHDLIPQAQEIFDNYVVREKITVIHQRGDRAFYNPTSDSITLPLIEQYPEIEKYYSTCFHEAAHSSGEKSRMNRSIKNAFADAQYSKEELIAEITSSILLGHCGILTETAEKNNIAYMQNWLFALQNNITLIVSASTQAQRAADYILKG